MPKRLKVISFFAGPGSGKSTLAAALFAKMKRARISVELVTEYAKDLTYRKEWATLRDQLHVLAIQDNRQAQLIGQVEWAITDSPLPLSIVYGHNDPTVRADARRRWAAYNNVPFLLSRTSRPFVREGRKETLQEAQELDRQIHAIGLEFGAARVPLDPDACDIEQRILETLGRRGLLI